MSIIVTDLKYYAELAYKILNGCESYVRGKCLIQNLFDFDLKSCENYSIKEIDKIILRLTVIDSYYSTNMGRRLYGIDELAEKLFNVENDDIKLSQRFINYLKTFNDKDICDLFDFHYGIHKDGTIAGKAISIITKYVYFLTKYNFPIYDSLAKESYEYLEKILKLTPIKNDLIYFKCMTELNKNSAIDDFNKLDNLLWLIGKIKNGNLASIMKKNDYDIFIKLIENYFNIKINDNIISLFIKMYFNKSLTLSKNDIKIFESIFSADFIEFLKINFLD